MPQQNTKRKPPNLSGEIVALYRLRKPPGQQGVHDGDLDLANVGLGELKHATQLRQRTLPHDENGGTNQAHETIFFVNTARCCHACGYYAEPHILAGESRVVSKGTVGDLGQGRLIFPRQRHFFQRAYTTIDTYGTWRGTCTHLLLNWGEGGVR